MFELNKAAITLYKEKKHSEAYKKLKKAQKLDPQNPIIRKGLKAIRKELLKEKDKLTPKKEKKVSRLFHQGISYYRDGNYKKAIECWKKVVILKPDHKRAHKYIKNVSKKLEKIERI